MSTPWELLSSQRGGHAGRLPIVAKTYVPTNLIFLGDGEFVSVREVSPAESGVRQVFQPPASP